MTRTAPLIGLVGRKRSGKDSLAKTLIEERGYTRLAFADALKDAALELDPIIAASPNGGAPYRLSWWVREFGWEAAKETYEVRRTLQAFGTAVRTHVKESAWLDVVASAIKETSGPIAVTDVRYPNEADLIQELGGVLVRVMRPGLDLSDTHVSETALDTRATDYTVSNYTDLASLRRQGLALADHLLLPGIAA